jgi:ABC-type nitrate/sulfonate/bicarbonate transport system substrate-binding protein
MVLHRKSRIGRSTFLIATILVLLACTAPVLAQTRTGPVLSTPVEVTIGAVPYYNDALWLAGEQLGFAQEVGLKIKYHVIGAYPEVHQALAGGSIDLAATIPQALVPSAGALTNVVWVMANDMWWGSGVLVRPGKLKTYQQFLKERRDPKKALQAAVLQLKGKTLIGNFAGGPGIYVPKLLELAGLSTSDVKMLNLPPGQGPAAFIRGEGDTFSGTLPDRARVMEEGAEVLIDARDMPFVEAFLYDGFAARRDWVAKNEDALMRLFAVHFRIADMLRTPERDKALDIMRRWVNKETGANFSMPQARWVFDTISPEPTAEEVSEWFYDPKSRYNFEKELERRITFFTAKGKLKPGVVAVDSHSMARELHEKYMGYKQKALETLSALRTLAPQVFQAKPEAANLMEWAEWHYVRRSYLDAAVLADQALRPVKP